MSITPRDPADFAPSRGNYTELKPFRFWCQKVLPLVYDDTLSYYELLCKVVDYLNKTMEDVETLEGDVTSLYTAYDELQAYVNTYFDGLDVQEEINNKLDDMATSGELTELLTPVIPDIVSEWLAENIGPTTPAIDKTLTIENAGADAKITGNIRKAIASYNNADYCIWHEGGINGNTGEITETSERIYCDFIEPSANYMKANFKGSERIIIDVHEYDSTNTYIRHVYNLPVYNGSVIGFLFDTTKKYRLVSSAVTTDIQLTGITGNDIVFGCGSINDGAFVGSATNIATIKPFTVNDDSILVVNVPNCRCDLFMYQNNAYVDTLSYRDTSNKIAYFPLSPLYEYRLYVQSEDHSNISAKIVLDYAFESYTGNTYNGIVISSNGNIRSSLIKKTNDSISISTNPNTTIKIDKYKNGRYLRTESYNYTQQKNNIFVGDCDFFYIASNDLCVITYNDSVINSVINTANILQFELGDINHTTGADETSSTVTRTNFFKPMTNFYYIDKDSLERYNISIFDYDENKAFVGYNSNYPIYRGGCVGYSFNTNHYYRFVSPYIEESFELKPFYENALKLGCGVIDSSGVFNYFATNLATIKAFSVAQPAILIVNTPNAVVNLFKYNENNEFLTRTRYQDTGNTVAYFSLVPGFLYRINIESDAFNTITTALVNETSFKLYVGGMYNGIVIQSNGNLRSNLITRVNHEYILIKSTRNVYIHKFKDSTFMSPSITVDCGYYSPAIAYVGDCDAFYFTTNDVRIQIEFEWFGDFNKLYGKKWCSYGDSITEMGRWQNNLVNKYGLVHTNKGLGGSCVTGNTASEVLSMCADARINTIPEESEIVTIMGGTNDFDFCTSMGSIADLQTGFNTSTFIGSVASIVKRVQNRCPNAVIILMSNVNSRGVTGQNADVQQVGPYGYTPYDFAKAMKECAEWLSVYFVDVWCCGINQFNRATYIEDSVHPNVAGGKLIAKKCMTLFDNLSI